MNEHIKHVRFALGLALCLISATAGAQAPAPETPGAEAAPVVPTPAEEPGAEPPAPPASAPPQAAEPAAPASDVESRLRQMQSTLEAQQTEIEALRAKAEEAEMAALLADDTDVEVEEEKLRLYGFMDFGLDKFFFDDEDDNFALLRPTKSNSFIFGNLNLYVDAAPTENWRALFEVRFTNLPHGEDIALGPPLGTSFERTDLTAFDFASPSSQSQLRLGSLFIERAWVQWTHSDLLQIRAGLWLNPFGIWNVDHGSPTLISLMLPTFVAARMMPARLLGIQARGSHISGAYEFGYRVHVSNGRGPHDYDMKPDKALGGRLFVAHEGNYGRTVLGTSGYYGTYRDQQKAIVTDGPGIFDWDTVVEYDEQLAAADLAVDVMDFRLRSEAVFRWVNYNGALRERIFTTNGSERYLPNRMEYNAYVLLSYRSPWRLEPYVEAEVMQKSFVLPRYAGNARATDSDSAAVIPSVGLNVALSSHTQLKLQYAVVYLMDDKLEETYFRTPIFFSRLVTSF